MTALGLDPVEAPADEIADRDWNEAGVWQRLHELLLAELNAAVKLDCSRCVVDLSTSEP